MSDEALHAELENLSRIERAGYPHLLACLAEAERRDLHLDRGYRTLFDYCVGVLRCGESVAAARIYAARAASKHPEIYAMLEDGSLTISGASRLSPYLNRVNASSVLSRASGRNKQGIEELIVELGAQRDKEAASAPVPEPEPQHELFNSAPVADDLAPNRDALAGVPAACTPSPAPTVVGNPLPEPAVVNPPSPGSAAPPPPETRPQLRESNCDNAIGPRVRKDIVRLDAPGILRITFWATTEFQQKVELVRRLCGRSDGRIETIMEIAMDAFLAYHENPVWQSGGRRTRGIKTGIKKFVWIRDEGRCAFTAPDGTRCEATTGLEYDHIHPWALGGSSDDPANIRLLCRAHNQHAARKIFGDRVPAARPT